MYIFTICIPTLFLALHSLNAANIVIIDQPTGGIGNDVDSADIDVLPVNYLPKQMLRNWKKSKRGLMMK